MRACEQFGEALSGLVDGTLTSGERRVVEAHLATCSACRALEGDLRRIRDGARGLERHDLPPDVWESVSQPLQTETQKRVLSRWRTVLPAAAAILLVVAGGVWLQMRSTTRSKTATAISGSTETPSGELAQSIETEFRLAEQHYEKAIGGLEQIANTQEKVLDPQVAATLQKNLQVIDQAIGESRAALRAQPSSRPAQESLFEAFRNKLTLLQDTVALVNEMRKGNQAEAARIVGGISR